MQEPDPLSDNPYVSPEGDSTAANVTRQVGLRGAACSFSVGVDEIHAIDIYWSHWTGLEVYSVDGEERHRLRSFAPSGTRRLTVGSTERHEVEIRVKLNKVLLWSSQVLVDGELHIEELFPGIRTAGQAAWIAVAVELGLLVVLASVAAAIWLLL